MFAALTMDDWTKIGVISGIFGTALAVLLTLLLRWLDHRVRLVARVRQGTRAGPLWATRPGEKVSRHLRFDIELQVTNMSKTPIKIA
jgi:hypothetical protein